MPRFAKPRLPPPPGCIPPNAPRFPTPPGPGFRPKCAPPGLAIRLALPWPGRKLPGCPGRALAPRPALPGPSRLAVPWWVPRPPPCPGIPPGLMPAAPPCCPKPLLGLAYSGSRGRVESSALIAVRHVAVVIRHAAAVSRIVNPSIAVANIHPIEVIAVDEIVVDHDIVAACPQPTPHPQPPPQPPPPPQIAPTAIPTPNEMALAATTAPVETGG